MDFFAAEERAKKRTARLLVFFVLAVAGMIAASYFGAVFALRAAHGARYERDGYRMQDDDVAGLQAPLWQPQVFGAVTLATLAVVGLASLYKWSSLRSGGAAVAESVGGRRVDPHTTDPAEHRLLNVVEEIAIAAGIPVPAVYVLDDEVGINAFAAGLTTSDAVVTVTRGALQKLTRDEMQGIIGHEFSHILNGDMRMNVRLTAILFGILVIGLAGRGILWSLRFNRSGSSRDGKGNGGVIAVLGIGIALLVVGYVGYFFGRLIQAAVSRQREFLADASSVQFTRNPAGIAGALKKIGGYAIGSSIDTHRAAEIGHFFFAQATPSAFGGLWATHPPLAARIRAIDPQFDGRIPEPPEVVDVAKEPWSSIGRARPAATAPASAPSSPAATAGLLVSAVGTLSPAAITHAQTLLDGVPPRLREAARSSHDAPALLYGLLLNDDPAARGRQKAVLASQAGSDMLRTLDEIEPALQSLKPEHKLPLLQLLLPALKGLPPTAIGPLADLLDGLVQADGRVSPFEFAMQKLVLRTLAVNRSPSAGVAQIYSFQAVADEISVVLSALAHESGSDESAAAGAFAAGAAQLRLLDGKLNLLPSAASTLELLDAALDKLAAASGPIKQRLLIAAAHVVGADGAFLTAEVELLRAVAAALDVPMPPLAAA